MLLYSTNVFMKYLIQKQYFGDVHYVWCSEHFDSRTLARNSPGALIAASSNPFEIYKEIQRDVHAGDKHSAKITAQKASLKRLECVGELCLESRLNTLQHDLNVG